MVQNSQVNIDISRALFLAEACAQAYNLFDNPDEFQIPTSYNLVQTFTATTILGTTELFGFIMESREDIVIAFRGTDSDADIITDLEFLQIPYFYIQEGGGTHAGFSFVYITCREQIISALRGLSTRKALYITGHSLGAALATLNTLDVAANTDFKQPIMYNFASPRTGNPAFTNTFNGIIKNSIRVANIYDIIPLLPPKVITIPFVGRNILYAHVENLFPIASRTGSLIGNHALVTYINALKKLAPLNLEAIEPEK